MIQSTYRMSKHSFHSKGALNHIQYKDISIEAIAHKGNINNISSHNRSAIEKTVIRFQVNLNVFTNERRKDILMNISTEDLLTYIVIFHTDKN